MEINTQQMEALLHLQEQQAQLPRKQQSGQTSGFEEILARQLEQDIPQIAPDLAKSMFGANYANPVLESTEDAEASDPDTAVLQAAFDQASGALDLWDSYTRTLGTSTSGSALRDAWGLLEGIDAQVTRLRDNPARARSSALDSILNELEVLAATERFKFNRGDYIS